MCVANAADRRHGESEWNQLNLFTGWYDVGLTAKGAIFSCGVDRCTVFDAELKCGLCLCALFAGHEEAIAGGKLLKEGGFRFGVAYTSYLKRAIRTCWHVLEQVSPITQDEAPRIASVAHRRFLLSWRIGVGTTRQSKCTFR